MDMKQRDDVRVLRRLFWLFGLALMWELIGRPLLGIFAPQLELPPSFLQELLPILGRLADLAF